MLVYFGLFLPILAILSKTCAHFGDLFTGLNNAVVYQFDNYQVCAFTLYIAQEENAWSSFVSSAYIMPQPSVNRTDQ